MKKNLLKELEEFVNRVLDIAGTIALENFRVIRDMTLKGDSSPVTKADMEIEQYIRTKILEKYPEINAVVHTHSVFASTLSVLGQDIPAFHYMIAPCHIQLHLELYCN